MWLQFSKEIRYQSKKFSNTFLFLCFPPDPQFFHSSLQTQYFFSITYSNQK